MPRDWIKESASATLADMPVPFWDAVQAAAALQQREENSNSASSQWRRMVRERNERNRREYGVDTSGYEEIPYGRALVLRKYEEQGRLEESGAWLEMSPRRREAYLRQREVEREHADAGDEALRAAMVEQLGEQRERDLETMARGNPIASFVGASGASLTDPLVLLTLPFGSAGFAGARTILGAGARVAAQEAAYAAAIEIPIQAEVYRFKQELGAPWSVGDALLNVGAATVGAGALSGLAGSMAKYGDLLQRRARAEAVSGLSNLRKPEDVDEILAAYEEMQRELNSAAIGNRELRLGVQKAVTSVRENAYMPDTVTAAEHLRNLDIARNQMESGQPIDVPRGALQPGDDWGRAYDLESVDAAEVVDAYSVRTDPERFQVKRAPTELTERWDADRAGLMLFWQDREGNTFVVDGHQRLQLAQMSGVREVQGFVFREENGVTASDMLQVSAIKNASEGTMSLTDTAAVLRETGVMGDGLISPRLSLANERMLADARSLADLPETVWRRVESGEVPEAVGVAVARAVESPADRLQLADLAVRAGVETDVQVRSVIEQGAQLQRTGAVRDAAGRRMSWEDMENAVATFRARAQLAEATLSRLRSNQRVFGRVLSRVDDPRLTVQQRVRRAEQEIIHRLHHDRVVSTTLNSLADRGDVSGAAAARVQAALERTLTDADGPRRAPRVSEPEEPTNVAPPERRAPERRVVEQQRPADPEPVTPPEPEPDPRMERLAEIERRVDEAPERPQGAAAEVPRDEWERRIQSVAYRTESSVEGFTHKVPIADVWRAYQDEFGEIPLDEFKRRLVGETGEYALLPLDDPGAMSPDMTAASEIRTSTERLHFVERPDAPPAAGPEAPAALQVGELDLDQFIADRDMLKRTIDGYVQMIQEHGDMATVFDEVNGRMVERPVREVIEELREHVRVIRKLENCVRGL